MRASVVRYLALGVLMVGLAAIAWTTLGGDGADDAETATNTTVAAEVTTTAVVTTTVPPEPIEVLGTADTLTDLDGWLNTDATSLEEIRAANKLTVVQFWTFGCRNCKNTLDALSGLYADFRDQGVEIVGVHSPEFSYEADVDNIIEAAADLGVIWPIALDTDKRNFHRWQPGNIGYWPRVYVIDGDNRIRFDRTGDGRATYEQLYDTVERLLADA
ncbi:MAG: redoxin domain-containing protein [Acidimicrobiaceae bacterium]|nr:redoxin domain-containing protein [Acidimicrobiaceae bacterium]